MNTKDRKGLLHAILDLFSTGVFFTGIEVNDTKKEHINFRNMLQRRGNIDISITEEKERSLLWFVKRDNK